VPPPASAYSATWFATFLQPIAPEQTAAEIAFVARQVPAPAYHTLLDLCCGPGRHARPLAAAGYQVTGVDWSADALAAARRHPAPGLVYLQHDMRQLRDLPGTFDAVICLWQSFGYFDPATNADILRQIHAKLAPQGRLILDLYHRDFFAAHQGLQLLTRAGRTIRETKALAGTRLTVTLDYGPDQPADHFAWELYTPAELIALAAAQGFHCRLACTGFDEAQPPHATVPRMQLVFERTDRDQ